MNKPVLRLVGVLAVLVLLLAGCGSDKDDDAGSSATTAAPTETTVAEATTTTEAAAAQTMTVEPSTGLKDGQTVHIVGKGFTAGAQRGVIECADKGEQTGSGDCDLGGIKTATAAADGTVTLDFAVKKGPFGQNNIVCGPAQKCLLSLSDLTAEPKELATMVVEFA